MLRSATEGVVTRRGGEIVSGGKKKQREFQPCWKKRSRQRHVGEEKKMIKSVAPLVRAAVWRQKECEPESVSSGSPGEQFEKTPPASCPELSSCQTRAKKIKTTGPPSSTTTAGRQHLSVWIGRGGQNLSPRLKTLLNTVRSTLQSDKLRYGCNFIYLYKTLNE